MARRHGVANKSSLPAALLSVDNEFRSLTQCRPNGLTRGIQTQRMYVFKCVCVCVCVCVCTGLFFFFSCARMRQGILGKTPDPESRTRNMRHYPVELSAPPFISIKTCNNARTLGWNCFLPFGSLRLDFGRMWGGGVFCFHVSVLRFFVLFIYLFICSS